MINEEKVDDVEPLEEEVVIEEKVDDREPLEEEMADDKYVFKCAYLFYGE